MGNDNQYKLFIDRKIVAQWLAEQGYLWQMDLLKADRLSSFASDRGLKLWSEDASLLWRLGLLRADLVVSQHKVRLRGLHYLKTDEDGQHVYADVRYVARRRRGWGLRGHTLSQFPAYVEPLFHPFRYLVLYRLLRVLELNIATHQMLFADRYPGLLDLIITRFQKYSGTNDFLTHLKQWDDLVTILVAFEPLQYTRIFHRVRYPLAYIGGQRLDEQLRRQHLAEYQSQLVPVFRDAGLDRLEEARRWIVLDAAALDNNTQLHVLLRLANADTRLRLQGKIGGAMLLWSMAEILRRMTEDVFQQELPEEDEMGSGWWPIGARERSYGTKRLFDGNIVAADEFLRHKFGLDFSESVRWYVEGDTEYAALQSIFEKHGLTKVTVINLRGQFVQKGGRQGASFRDSLRKDIRQSVFSFVSLDADAEDNIRMLRVAAEREEFFGQVFISTKDFEFGNFDLVELEQILWEIASNWGADSSARWLLHEAILGIDTGKELLRAASRAVPELSQLGKGEEWGEKLINYALNNPKRGNGAERPIFSAVVMAYRSGIFHYRFSREAQQVNSSTFEMEKRTRPLPGTGPKEQST